MAKSKATRMANNVANNVRKNLNMKNCTSLSKILMYGLLIFIVYQLFTCMMSNKNEYSKSKKRKEYLSAMPPSKKTIEYMGNGPMSYYPPSNKPEFVFYYVDWCGHCKKTKPEWEKMDTTVNNIKCCAVNCVEHKTEGEQMGVRSYPTFMYFPNGRLDPASKVPYSGNRTVADWKSFLNSV